jgi:hypothetical protein
LEGDCRDDDHRAGDGGRARNQRREIERDAKSNRALAVVIAGRPNDRHPSQNDGQPYHDKNRKKRQQRRERPHAYS